MNINDLKIFEAIAAHGSFTKAAEATFTVQSNVTARIKNLEEEFGSELFVRSPRKVALTKSGEILIQYSKQIVHLLEQARKDIHGTELISGLLKIGCIETTMALKVPEILTNFSTNYPNVDLEFKSAMRAALIDDVLSYKLDAAFISAPVNTPGLNQESIKTEQLVIVAPENTKSVESILTKDKPLTIVVFDQGCIFRARLEAWLSARGIAKYKSIVVNSLEGIINFVEAGIGISILPSEIINTYYLGRRCKTFTMNKELATLVTVLIYRSNVPPSKPLQAFIEMYQPLENLHILTGSQ